MTQFGEVAAFAEQLPFPMDPFQIRACEALEAGHGVLVCAPTGAGKTIVGEFAVHLALRAGRKCFYTTPIKALSNQKFNDLVKRYDTDTVGLLTGDQSINSDAPIVVMTTEVLRNMLYADSDRLRGLSHVVMDEVHFLADRFRGAVWEEVILHLAEDVRLVSLSATVSNAEEFGAWMETVRGDTTVIVDETRPIPLWQHMLVGRKILDLFPSRITPGKSGRKLNPDLLIHIKKRLAIDAAERGSSRFEPPRHRRGGRGPRGNIPGRYRPPSRPEVIIQLDKAGLLPAITFVFSRAGCDAAVAQCVRSGLFLTSEDEAKEIRRIIAKHTGELPEADLKVLGFDQWRTALERGIAAHHAGMLPAFRHTVEELFVNGYVKAVFATETLALGINMPARSVVLESLVKFNGDTHADLTPGEYTQLTGRAGRRGIDVEGHAVVLWQPNLDPEAVGGLASTRTFPLRSSFAPGYNMAVNLLRHMPAAEARALLERSFAQFQTDRSVVGVARTVERNERELAKLAGSANYNFAEFAEYAALRRAISDRERTLKHGATLQRRDSVAESLVRLKRGDVIVVPAGRRAGPAVVLEPDRDFTNPQPLVITAGAWSGRLSVKDFVDPTESVGSIRLPKHVDFREAPVRRDIASTLRNLGYAPRNRQNPKGKKKSDAAFDKELARLRRELKRHPCHSWPDREECARRFERYDRLKVETDRLRNQMNAASSSLGRNFDRIVELLSERSYIELGSDPVVTEEGEWLRRIYSESDLLIAEALRRGIWKGLSPAELAAVVSAVVYEARRDGAPAGTVPTGPLRRALADTQRIWEEIFADETRHKLPTTREPDSGFVHAIFVWAQGAPLLDALLAANEIPPGDFVRWCRQILDLLEQLRIVAPDPQVRSAAGKAVTAVKRGVVSVDATE
ncbi:DEAD/DEAH box helicase [Hoyosella rhizosphaerae]|uniref:ATP-dependent DNA helicase HelY n=1 Tax=Hoyosella rhizosphaerae TaxID=1755582 RepID=A0A916X8A9_9ACTN|nr:DEAD/DEAH box helicase [Hoyosella rhizosphaerae]MBN4927076.1 DEAD/DEAH box helicase [Hoyosella rhizosphaerae]GGC54249.1 putative ATP-dependent DNA helicase HelY [Hoyosella rhizosphaerae]